MTNIEYYIPALLASIISNYLFIKYWKFEFLKSTIKSDRWGTKIVPLTGGISIFLIFIIFSVLKFNEVFDSPIIVIALIGGVLIFTLGVIDDIINLKSHQKFLLQIIIVIAVVYFGVETTLFPRPLSFVITVLWILGITNAFNLLDNIDGLSAGIASIAAVTLGIKFLLEGNILLSYFCFILTASFIGFLIYNFNPAKIYLGDCGALFTGYILSTLTILGTRGTGKSLFASLLFPIVIMMIPVLDTILVSITRKIRGQSPFEGGKDHLSHRLVMLGMTEKQSVLFLYIISILLATSTFLITNISLAVYIMMYFFLCLIIVLFGFYIGKIKMVARSERKNNFLTIGTTFLYKKRIIHILVDLVLLAFIYFFSYVIRFEGNISSFDMSRFVESLPLVILIKILFLYYFKVYKIENRFFSVSDGVQFLKGVTLSTISIILFLTVVTRFQGYSRVAFIIDWMLTIIVLGGVKMSYRLFDELFFSIKSQKTKKMIILGKRETYQAINRYLQLKTDSGYSVKKFFNTSEVNLSLISDYLEKSRADISMVLLEDKKILSNEDIIRLNDNGILVVNEKEFFNTILS